MIATQQKYTFAERHVVEPDHGIAPTDSNTISQPCLAPDHVTSLDNDFGKPTRSKNKSRAVLSSKQVQEIFEHKRRNMNATSSSEKISSPVLAKIYGVGEKTIRDIWNGRTWFRETSNYEKMRSSKTCELNSPSYRRKEANKHADMQFQKKCRGQARPKAIPCIKTDASPKTTFDKCSERNDVAIGCMVQGWLDHTQPQTASIHAATWLAAICMEHDQGLTTSQEFVDPFHNDWAYWPKVSELGVYQNK